MPTYSYKCTECGTAFDIQQAFTDDTLTECPNCGGKLRKVFTAIGVTFNGSGFYRNDSRAASKSTEKSGSESKTSESKSSDSKSSESKPSGAKTSESKSTPSTTSTPAASPSKAAG